MNIFTYLSEYKDLNEEKRARDWVAVGVLFNLLVTKHGRNLKLAKHQERFLRDVRQSFNVNFGNGSKQESKLIRYRFVKRLAEALECVESREKQMKLDALIVDVAKFCGPNFRTMDRKALSEAKMRFRQRSSTQAALSYAESMGTSEKEFKRTKKDLENLERQAAKFWGYDLNTIQVLFPFFTTLLGFTEEQAFGTIKLVYSDILPQRTHERISLVLGEGRKAILASVLRCKGTLDESQISKQVEREFPNYAPTDSSKEVTPDSELLSQFTEAKLRSFGVEWPEQ